MLTVKICGGHNGWWCPTVLNPEWALGGLECGVVWWRALVFYLECVSKCSVWLC